MITTNETWENQDSDRNDFDNNTNSFSVNNEADEFDNSNDLEEDDDTTDAADYDETDDLLDDDDLTDDLDATDTDEIPEEGETENEGVGSHNQSEVNQPDSGADTSYSEQTDVTPPNKHEFPSVGAAKTDFESRPQGRTTGRMVGHEPGTEGI